ncbi:DUF3006 domain-containing protein [Rossellomorea vietnamensis]|uniref:DUF3006 domain-containing protein n=1 Tax=Rossellomorea vietnamensis TaxID=218284 RepID=A0ACD4C7U5_9BACI|nr:DUF3006 domain-containing protein [Rossellomorea vietnamensis]UXH44469.1 DUF3006 domain-containing protein [Rossellomorea vietnamensis]
MNTKTYTLDQIEGEKATLLLRSDESEELIVDKEKILPAVEGDILELTFSEKNEIQSSRVLVEETKSARLKANDLLQKLIDKNN